MESKLSTIGVTVQANLKKCSSETPASTWTLLEQRPEADLFALEGEDTYALRITPTSSETFNCYYHFSSAQEMYEKSTAAVELTLQRLESAPKTR